DTPNNGLFARHDRALSHGCIRLEKPLDLAEWLLRSDPAWNHDKLVEQIGTKARHTVRLSEPVPVHLTYVTAFVDDQGRLQLRPDVYGIDEKLANAFHPSSAAPAAHTLAAAAPT